MFAADGLDVRKWAASHPIFSYPYHLHINSYKTNRKSEYEPSIKIFGVQSNPDLDFLGYKIQPLNGGCSKSIILSEIAKNFDSIGLLEVERSSTFESCKSMDSVPVAAANII